jgi:N-acetylglutamate synthase-like GNAT family acetyltransferase
MNAAGAVPIRLVRRSRRVARPASRAITLRTATAAEAAAIHALILDHLEEGHLLPRELAEIVVRADRFVVALSRGRVVACAELAPLSSAVAEIRSLVVSRDARRLGLGRRIVDELIQRAEAAGFRNVCAFTHSPAYFVHMGFSIVPHVWVPEKIVTDCHSCVHFRRCGQYAVMYQLTPARDACVPLAALHG